MTKSPLNQSGNFHFPFKKKSFLNARLKFEIRKAFNQLSAFPAEEIRAFYSGLKKKISRENASRFDKWFSIDLWPFSFLEKKHVFLLKLAVKILQMPFVLILILQVSIAILESITKKCWSDKDDSLGHFLVWYLPYAGVNNTWSFIRLLLLTPFYKDMWMQSFLFREEYCYRWIHCCSC